MIASAIKQGGNNMKKENGYWIDENNNKWDCKDTDEELAIIYSRFMCNCDNCTNCYNCSNCHSCMACHDCYDCDNCFECNSCGKCDNCTNCNHLYACNDLEDCTVCKTVTFD